MLLCLRPLGGRRGRVACRGRGVERTKDTLHRFLDHIYRLLDECLFYSKLTMFFPSFVYNEEHDMVRFCVN